MKIFLAVLVALAPLAARAGDGVFDAVIVVNSNSSRGMSEIVRMFNVCFDPKGKERKLGVRMNIEAGSLKPEADFITVKSDGTYESRMRFTYQVTPQGRNDDPKGEACYRFEHKLTVPGGGLAKGTKVLLKVVCPELKKRGRGTHQAENIARVTVQ